MVLSFVMAAEVDLSDVIDATTAKVIRATKHGLAIGMPTRDCGRSIVVALLLTCRFVYR